MRLATFNLESLDSGAKAAPSLALRAEVLRPQLERLAADILCLQEVNGQHVKGGGERVLAALDALIAGTPYAGFHRAATRAASGKGVADVHNLVTFSRYPIVAHEEIRNALMEPLTYRMVTAEPPQPAARLAFDRPVLRTTIGLPDGARLELFNVHLRAPLAVAVPGQKQAPFVWRSVAGWAEGCFLSAVKRSAQALELRLAIDRLLDSDPHRLIAVAGDFNAGDRETPLRILIGAEDDTGNGRLAPRALGVLDRAIADDRRFSVLHHGRPEMLDHILASRSLMGHFRAIEVHNEMLADEASGYAKSAAPTGSYHAPLVADLAIG